MVNQLPFLALLDRLDDQSDLLAELIDAVAIKIGYTGVGMQYSLDRAEVILSRMFLVIDECCWQLRLIGIDSQKIDFMLLAVFVSKYAIDPIDAAVYIDPRQQLVKPPRGDGLHLRNC